MDRITLRQNIHQWQTLVKAAMNPLLREVQCILGLAEQLVVSAGF
jgi:hypothetical protein